MSFTRTGSLNPQTVMGVSLGTEVVVSPWNLLCTCRTQHCRTHRLTTTTRLCSGGRQFPASIVGMKMSTKEKNTPGSPTGQLVSGMLTAQTANASGVTDGVKLKLHQVQNVNSQAYAVGSSSKVERAASGFDTKTSCDELVQ